MMIERASTVYPESIRRLVDELAKLPGVGPRTAERLAFHLVRADRAEVAALAQAIRDVVERVGTCSQCFNLSEQDPCPVCADPTRDRSRILVVEHPKDLEALERTGYRGIYHVLLGRVSPLDEKTRAERTILALVRRVVRPEVEEVILGTNPDLEGDGTALAVQQSLRDALRDRCHRVRLSRLARGVPTGASLEHVNTAVLAEALNGRTHIENNPPSRGGTGVKR
ncbi:MAG: recombination mediator RecR [Planctomycetota bacterium]